ncbi:MAG TPA: hypothetical protein DD806_04950, partial [Flavobacterium sp.]|nr:hypothetical protein [Flavobacterium sp.]
INYRPQFGQNFSDPRLQFGQQFQNFSAPKPQSGQHFQNFSAHKPQFNQNPKPNLIHNKPEPMEIDQSLRSRQVNYQNRPEMPQLGNKRTLSQQVSQNPNKFQRIFHTEQSPDENLIFEESYNQQFEETEENAILEEHNEFIDTPNDPIPDKTIDNINFLE